MGSSVATSVGSQADVDPVALPMESQADAPEAPPAGLQVDAGETSPEGGRSWSEHSSQGSSMYVSARQDQDD